MLKQQIDKDLKAALLSGDKATAVVLRGLKSAILYAEVEKGARQQGLDDASIVALLAKEAKKRQESADLYSKGGDESRASAELSEKAIIETYLPKQISDDELRGIINDLADKTDAKSVQDMGKLIGAVKSKVGASADGSRVAKLVKETLSK